MRNDHCLHRRLSLRLQILVLCLLFGLRLAGPAAAQPWSQLGLADESLETLAVDPTNPLILFAGHFSGGGVFRSLNGGSTWTAVNTGLTLFSGTRTSAITVDPHDPMTVYVGLSTLPNLFKSTDGGTTWSAATSGLGSGEVSAIVVDPVVIDPPAPAPVYASANGFGVAKSLDGGATWSDASSGLEDGLCDVSCILDLVIDPSQSNVLYAAAPVLSDVYKTTDSGASWTPTSAGITAETLALDPQSPQTLFVAASLGGLKKTVDGGGVWTSLDGSGGLPANASYRAITLNPAATHTVFVDGDDLMYRSDDGGLSWSLAEEGLAADFVRDLAHTGGTALAATDDGVFAAPEGLLFADGFESGDTTAWSSVTP